MAVEFPSDLILDVARAADPARAQSVQARLSSGAAGSDATSTVAKAATMGSHLSRVAHGKDPKEASKEFEALLVANMVKNMMGDSDESYFGGGFSGSVWKSMMADQIAAQVVKNTDFGVASKINKYLVRDGEDVHALHGINDAEATPSETRAIDAARSGTNEISRDFIHKMMSAVGSGDKS